MQSQTIHSLTCSSLISGNEFEIWSTARLPGSNELLDASPGSSSGLSSFSCSLLLLFYSFYRLHQYKILDERKSRLISNQNCTQKSSSANSRLTFPKILC